MQKKICVVYIVWTLKVFVLYFLVCVFVSCTHFLSPSTNFLRHDNTVFVHIS